MPHPAALTTPGPTRRVSALLVLSGSPQRASAPGIAIPFLQAAEPAQTGAADGQRQCEPRSRIPRSSAHGVRRSPLASVFHAKPPPSGGISGPHATARSERTKALVCTSGGSGLRLRASATPPLRASSRADRAASALRRHVSIRRHGIDTRRGIPLPSCGKHRGCLDSRLQHVLRETQCGSPLAVRPSIRMTWSMPPPAGSSREVTRSGVQQRP